MPTYDHLCNACNHEWEESYSIKADVPTICPNCKTEGQVKRLISASGGVTVKLEGKELVNQLRKEGKDLARRARKDENLAANLYGWK